jgi:hypothetical protein
MKMANGEENNTSAVMEPRTVTGTVTNVEVSYYEGDFGPITRLNLELDNPHFDAPAYRRWKFTRNDKGELRRNCQLAKNLLRPLKTKEIDITDFDQLKGLTLKIEEIDESFERDDGSVIDYTSWKLVEVFKNEDDAFAPKEDEEDAEEEVKETPKPKTRKKSKKKAEPEPEPEEDEDDEDDDEPDETEDELQSYIHNFLKEKPRRRFKLDSIVADVVKEHDVDDNEVKDAIDALKKAKKVREPKFGSYQVV